MNAVHAFDGIIEDVMGGGIGGNCGGIPEDWAWELEESKPLSTLYRFVLIDVLSLVRRIEFRVAVLIWFKNAPWSRGIIGGIGGGVSNGERTFESIAELFPRRERKGKDQWCGIAQVDKSDEKSVSQDNVSLLSFFASQWSNDDWTHLTFVFMNVSTSIVTSCK